MDDRKDLSLVYLGLRGGGLNFLKLVCDSLTSKGIFFKVHIATDIFEESRWLANFDSNAYRIPHSFLGSIRFNVRILYSLGMLCLNLRNSQKVLFIMPHPFDLPILFFIKKFTRGEIIYVVHDLQNHEGERWPSFSAIRRRIKLARVVIALSNYVADDIRKKVKTDSEIHVLPLSVSVPHDDWNLVAKLAPTRRYFVIAGRMKIYKGIEDFVKFWVENRLLPNVCLVIAGEGARGITERVTLDDSVIVINKWLPELDLWDLIYSSEGVIIPYREATQSGILEIAKALGKPVLVSNSGALPEQVSEYLHAVVVDNSWHSWKHGLLRLGRMKTYFEKQSTEKFDSALLKILEF